MLGGLYRFVSLKSGWKSSQKINEEHPVFLGNSQVYKSSVLFQYLRTAKYSQQGGAFDEMKTAHQTSVATTLTTENSIRIAVAPSMIMTIFQILDILNEDRFLFMEVEVQERIIPARRPFVQIPRRSSCYRVHSVERVSNYIDWQHW